MGLRPQVQAIILAMEVVIASLKWRLAYHESRLNRTPQNSSLPPSSVHPPNREKPASKLVSGRRRGGPKGHPKQDRALVPPERCSAIIPLHPTECRRCGTELSGEDPNPLRHQVWGILPIQPTITEYVSSNLPRYHFRRATRAILRSVDRKIDRTTSIEGHLGVGRCPVAVVLA